ncbi:MAG: tol-pal system protein YbgF [Paracoccaceae bacterium]|nr:tol-pal system protein YbgF [Paracoccaceae bacterium]
MRWAWLLCALLSVPAALSSDERAETLADIRQSLTLLHVEISKLRRELIPSSDVDVLWMGDTMLTRIDSVEQVLTSLTSKTEELEFRISRIIADGTNRIGDLEFRLVDLEGGDVSQLAEISTLGGDVAIETAIPVPKDPPNLQMAVGEQADFSRASQAFEQEDFAKAADLLGRFIDTYPGGPLNPQAFVVRGKAFEALGDTKAAAQSYLESYSRHPQAEVAPEALLRLGLALDSLQQTKAACKTLGEVVLRFPQSTQVTEAQLKMKGLNCS